MTQVVSTKKNMIIKKKHNTMMLTDNCKLNVAYLL